MFESELALGLVDFFHQTFGKCGGMLCSRDMAFVLRFSQGGQSEGQAQTKRQGIQHRFHVHSFQYWA
ncbi:MAG: hypothetical protein ABT21_15115 [Thiobacillus sp. SCN 65-179]|nr:MAG: hypothetical protein ABT21_15115 [Thiobacillus sp. SCN 65-179]